ncbi:Mitochondrial import receptor subunit TOM22-like protein [Aphelenchoides fujianensis]|nr:Mitochondrial import receptor subunit TOM22-like protein [Aphelenchoides fujianensis]
MNAPIDWDAVPDEELHESCWERVEALKEMFPVGLRKQVASTADWSTWATKKTFAFTKSALWIGTTSACLMILPVIIERELAEMAKSQILQQQQMLLGPTGAK